MDRETFERERLALFVRRGFATCIPEHPEMSDGRSLRGFLRNLPIPEPIIVAIVTGAGLHYVVPVPLRSRRLVVTLAGGGLIVAGSIVIVWSTVEAWGMRISEPDRLLTTGPYRLSRNPMYLGWLAVAVGLALVLNALWIGLMTAVAFLHLHGATIADEEQVLAERFGDAYVAYHNRVRRYL
jgi:protein-S-isoprenylcysteine O-methyltransferase Ste14